ncbi:MAG: type I-E CRISPR-associated protein Cas6/Cse3/CasE [Candidatus Fermentibacteraceae bacterium]|nr:type I-E CRISPR-associated protein Cas6/Cse3/CasE [Candidatus Fermentibacteraceae bacterium]MBN2609312.1 type I-E CRISPR-associated protein Cas6/Cse3/CasE [Candidatus Fermentibacteraceae bacterium]
MTEKYYMVSIELALDEMVALAHRRRLPIRNTDTGYFVHVQLKELFGEQAPVPFAIRENHGRMLKILGYSRMDSKALRSVAESFSDPSVYRSCNWSSLADKPMPIEWKEGQLFGFELRACPVVRMDSSSDKHRKGAEVDVFLRECWENSDPVERGIVYRDWLASNLDRQGGAKLRDFSLTGFIRQKLMRRRHGSDRKSTFIERPDATIRGVLEVNESGAFTQLIERGIGRHRSFGFGMILLRPLD